jgi:hypothetical protein
MTVQPPTIEAEVERWYRDSFEKPIAGKKQPFVEAVAAVYAWPMRYLDLDGEIMLGDAAGAKAFIQGFSDWLDSAPGWTARVARIQVRALNASAAALVVDWQLHDAQGKSLAGGDPAQYFYMASKHAGGWKVVSEATVMAETRIDFA